jgi:hypothetical protein
MAMNGKKDTEMAEEQAPKQLGCGRRNQRDIGGSLQPPAIPRALIRAAVLQVAHLRFEEQIEIFDLLLAT